MITNVSVFCVPHTGEGAHATFAPRGWKQRALSSFAEAKLGGHVEVEQVGVFTEMLGL